MGRHSPTSNSPGYTTMVNCNSKLVLAGIFVLIGLCAAKVKCPVRYEGNNPQMRKAYLDIDIGTDFFPNGWKLALIFDKDVKDVEIPQTRREASRRWTPKVYSFQNRGYNFFLRGPTTLLLHITELAEVKKGQKYAALTNAKVANLSKGAKWYELCMPEVIATPPPPPAKKPPCTDFYNLEMNDIGHGKTNEYEGDLNITYPETIVGFSFDVTFNKAPKPHGIFIDNVSSKKLGGNTFQFKPYQSNAQIRLHEGELVPRWDQSGQFNFGHFKVQLNKPLPRKESQMPVPIKIVTNFYGKKGVKKFVMCEG